MTCAGSTATRSSPPRSQLRAGSPISLRFLATVLLFCAGMLFVMAVIVGLFWCLMAVYDTLIVGLFCPSSTPRGQVLVLAMARSPPLLPQNLIQWLAASESVGSLWCRPRAAVDFAPSPLKSSSSELISDADDGLARRLRIGDSVLRRGEPYTVVAIDRSLAPIAVTVQHQTTGAVVHTELSYLPLPCDCCEAPSLPLLRVLMMPFCGSAIMLLAILTRLLMFPFCLLRFAEVVVLVRLFFWKALL